MKKILYTAILALGMFAFTACELDKFPETDYTEHNYKGDTDDGGVQYTTREDMQGLVNSLYNSWVKDIQEKDYLDWLIYAESRADNAYAGNPSGSELVGIESNVIDGANPNVARDWNWYLGQISNANNIICYIDDIAAADTSMTQREHEQWKSEALCWRAYCLYKMTMLWGAIPMTLIIPPAITAENVEEVYDLYYPARTPVADVYAQIVEDLEYAAQFGPDLSADKYRFTKTFAHGMLARVYAEKPLRDYDKVIEHCRAVEAISSLRLCDDYGEMWAYDDGDATRNTSESIFEVTWTKSQGNWVYMMFHRNAYNPNDSYSWMKWVTPSRRLTALYDAEGDTERKNACIVYDACGWSTYYPADNYAFMHKVPTNASSIILMRLAEIYLLHAEALTLSPTQSNLSVAADYVNQVRERAGLDPLPASAQASADAMIDAILHERQLELAFEGFRFFDLVRLDRVKEVHDGVNNPSSEHYDSYFLNRMALTDETILLPIPTAAMNTNPSLEQNPGY